ncbi:MAG TPA: alpha/beta hydrolase domain-containing protein [Casimicrobiaceae bacterium]|nr:alpha/beta hydrolase domain-containing protein [Casimicrobiaceae bacterium]
MSRNFGRSAGALSILMLALVGSTTVAHARITRFVIDSRDTPTFGGTTFGAVGAYEKIKAHVTGEVDPRDPKNALIQDINLAPKNARGNVEYTTTVLIYKPVDPTKGSGLLFYSVPNRGNLGGFPGHVGGGGNDPTTAADAGDGFLMKRGDTVVFSGWQGDILPGNSRQLLTVPVAKNADGSSITGRVRYDYALNAAANSLVLSQTFYSGTSHVSYETASLDNSSATLTMRVHVNDTPVTIPNAQWAFADCTNTPFPGTPDTRHICLQGGFDTNHLYELTYTAKDPLVLGLGFAATRDLGSFLLHATQDDAGTPNPVAGTLRAATMVGDSQSGNFVRSYIDLGFNQDENGKMVFNGVNANLAGKRTILNARFAQPGGGSSQHEYYLVPGAEFPVAYDSTFDPVTQKTAGLLDRCKASNTCPKVIQSATSTEYWQYVESLNHTDPTGTTDLPVGGDVRFYHFTGTQHGPAANPAGICQQPGDPAPILEIHRALFVALEDWVLRGKAPPPSKTSTIADGTLVKVADLKWPKIPGVTPPGVINLPTVIDFGPAYDPRTETGVFSEPTRAITSGTQYGVRVPQVDADGNEIGGVRSPTIQVPLGTYTGWGLRRAGFGEGDLCQLQGQFIPFAKTAAERVANGDPRPSLEERYGRFSGYYYALAAAVNGLVRDGFLLPEDAGRVFNAGLAQVLNNNLLPKDALAIKLLAHKELLLD